MSLRPYQVECEQANLKDYREGYRSLLDILPTGTGKTVLFSQAPKWFPGKRSLIVAHTEELVDQAADKIRHWNPSLSVGVEMADRRCRDSDDVVVASVATLGREGSLRLSRFVPNEFGAIVVDESHHIVASSYKRLINHFGFGVTGHGPESRLLLGVTATSGRGDGQGLGQVFDKVSYQYSMLQAIKDGWICPPVGYRIRTDVSIDDVNVVAGEFQQSDLSRTVNTQSRNRLIVQNWLELGQQRKTLGFTADIKHAVDLAAEFVKVGVKAEAVWGEDPDRAAKLNRHRFGQTMVLLNCGVLIEGYDDWQIACVLLCSPTKSSLRFIQEIGRGTRLQEGTGNLNEAIAAGIDLLKRDCIILDFQDLTTRHSLITLPSLFGLPAHYKLDGKTILEAIEEMEELEREYPSLDFDNLEDIDDAASYIESVNLFANDVDKVIAELSNWRWALTPSGGYVLNLPNKDAVHLTQNLLGHWEIKGQTTGVEFEDFDTELGNAVCSAERLIKQFWKGRKTTLIRKTKQPGETLPHSSQQAAKIASIATYLGDVVPDLAGVNFYEAQLLINSLQNRTVNK